MTTRTQRATILALFLTCCGAAVAQAAGPVKGRTYEGYAPRQGVSSEGHHPLELYAGGKILLKVSGSGKTVTVHFTSTAPVLYCQTSKRLAVQTSNVGRISSSGSFSATVGERFAAGPGQDSIVQLVSGRFSGSVVSGTIETRAGGCSGSSHFSARAK